MMWLIALAYGILTGFQYLTPAGMAVITGLMLLGATSDYWLPLFGIKTDGASCSAIFGTIVGGIIGTFAIPIPLLGTLIGSVIGAMVMELLRVGDLKKRLRAGHFAVRTYFIGLAMELVFSLAIAAVFFAVILF
jgi:uncharacterized protein YqgC (DUF456 family)